jgi:phosphate:Na+ symporter
MIAGIELVGGLALFLFGVRTLSAGMEKAAGDQIQAWLDRVAGKALKGAVFGAAATALIQSSSLLMVTMIGLINARLLTLEQAVGIMLGQEVGTTMTAQVAAFRLGEYSLLFVVAGFVLTELAPEHGWREYGEILLGFGVLFVGMGLMTGALESVIDLPAVAQWLSAMGTNQVEGILAGTIATAVVQSSSAVTALVVAMGSAGAITLQGAIALLLGANIGTCITGLIASTRLSRSAQRASLAQILINVIGVILIFPFVGVFADVVGATAVELPRQIANAHTIFNVAVSVLLLPFVKQISALARVLVPKGEEERRAKLTAFIDESMYKFPSVALSNVALELQRFGQVTSDMVGKCRCALIDADVAAADWVVERESEFVDPVAETLEDFVNTLMRSNLSVRQQERCFQIKSLITDIERVGDLSENLAQAAQKRVAEDISFSRQAMVELDQLCTDAGTAYQCALDSLRDSDQVLARKACRLEDSFDQAYLRARQGHIDRLREGICQPEADVIFVESLRNLERISDHADNLGVSVLHH